MRIYTKTTKVLSVTKDEAMGLINLANKAIRDGKAEVHIEGTQFLAVEVAEHYMPAAPPSQKATRV